MGKHHLIDHQSRHAEKCQNCKKVIHTGKCQEIKFFHCQNCDHAAKTKPLLNRHILFMHSKIKPSFPCDQCEKSFAQPSGLQLHKKVEHNVNKRPFKCDVCDSDFKLKHHLI